MKTSFKILDTFEFLWKLNKVRFEPQFCSICGHSFETEYKLVKHLNIAHREAISGGCCSGSHKHHEH